MSYIPNTDADQARMLEAIGVRSVGDLFSLIPEEIRTRATFEGVEPALDDISLRKHLLALSSKNADMDRYPCFLGGGIYDHYIPPTVGHITGRSEFYTAYTPYQPEVSQGVLQSIYEFQSLICRLTGMEVANASLYDGASALAEGVIMARDLTNRTGVVVARSVQPSFRQTVTTYLEPPGSESTTVVSLPWNAVGQVDPEALAAAITSDTACVVVQQPNYFGVIEDLEGLARLAHAHGALLVVSVDPIALGLLATPAECDADIVTGEGQALGCYPAFGGPLLGLFACRKEYIRRLPGRIVGATFDTQGTRAYVMTLRTREQDIRRDQATSNICTNQALFALAATVYLSTMGKSGLRTVADTCVQNAHYAMTEICRVPGYEMIFTGPFFKEFAIRCSGDPDELNRRLLDSGIIGGLPLVSAYPELGPKAVLICVTEQRTRAEIDALVRVLRGS